MNEPHITGSAKLVDHEEKTVFHLSGKDPTGMLDAILTNEVPKTKNLGVYAFLLDARGRVQTDLLVVKIGDDVLLLTEREGADAARDILGRYAPFSRVRVDEPDYRLLGLYGEDDARELLGLALSEHESEEIEVSDRATLAVGVETPIPGFILLLPKDSLETVKTRLLELGASPSSIEDYEAARVTSGIPRFGADITPENFPGESTALDRAVSFQKGCYPGQETVARMHYRGQPNKTLHRFTVEGEPPEPGTPIFQNEKEVGVITSVAPLPAGEKTFALGYLRRKADPSGELHAGESPLKNTGPPGFD